VLVLAVLLLAAAVAAGTYAGLERLGTRGIAPAVFRGVAWAALGLLLANLSCRREPESVRPLVLLDASLSMRSAGGQWDAARRAAAGLGGGPDPDIRLVSAVPGASDSAPSGGRSLVAGALTAAAATARPVWLLTDGEVEDLAEIPPDLLARTGVKLFPRASRPDLAITRVMGPDRLTAGDTLRLEVDVRAFGMPDRRNVSVEVREMGGTHAWLRGAVPLNGGSGSVVLRGKLPEVAAGPHLLAVALRDAGDAEPRTDLRLHLLSVTPTPGIVIVGAPASWESRFLFRTLLDVAALPVRGYFLMEGSRWRRMGDLTAATAAEVERATQQADLLVLLGEPDDRWRRSTHRVRGRWEWIAAAKDAAPTDGDWYLAPAVASPVSGAFIGLPVDSFPPGLALATLTPGPQDWVGLNAQLNRRGAEHPAIVGRDSAGHREVQVGVAGLWRWAFRGGSSEQGYRSWVAATTAWLLGASDSVTGRARPLRAVVQQGRPVVFERARPDSGPVGIELRITGGAAATRRDTLRFDGAGRAELFLQPGRYEYRLQGGGGGVLGVEVYSDEWLPRPVALTERPAAAPLEPSRTPARERLWLFALAVAGLSGEWWARRRMGLR